MRNIFSKAVSTIRNGITSHAQEPQVFAAWDFSAPYTLATTAGASLFEEIATKIGREYNFSDEQIEAIANRVARRIGDGLFTARTAESALRREFNFARYNK